MVRRSVQVVLGGILFSGGLFIFRFSQELMVWQDSIFDASRQSRWAFARRFIPPRYNTGGRRTLSRIGGAFMILFGLGLIAGLIH